MNSFNTGKAIEILLIEDSEDDIYFMEEALRKAKLNNKLYTFKDGEAALSFLYNKENFIYSSYPDLIFLDLNLPKKSGLEILREIKSNPELKKIPVAVLTSSHETADIQKAYELYANCYVCKPVGFDELVSVIQKFNHFWIEVVKLPNRED